MELLLMHRFSYKMYSDAGSGFAGDETMFHAIEDLIKHNVDVVSISSGFTGTGLVGEKYWQAIRALRKAGIPMVVATGNYDFCFKFFMGFSGK